MTFWHGYWWQAGLVISETDFLRFSPHNSLWSLLRKTKQKQKTSSGHEWKFGQVGSGLELTFLVTQITTWQNPLKIRFSIIFDQNSATATSNKIFPGTHTIEMQILPMTQESKYYYWITTCWMYAKWHTDTAKSVAGFYLQILCQVMLVYQTLCILVLALHCNKNKSKSNKQFVGVAPNILASYSLKCCMMLLYFMLSLSRLHFSLGNAF